MNTESFDLLVAALEGLTAEQRLAVADRVKVLCERADSARLIAERAAAPAACAHCASPDVVRFGFAGGRQRMRCKACGKTFTALSGTPFLRLLEKEKLLAHAECMGRGMTVRATAAAVGLTVDRAFRWRHRFLAFLAGQQPAGMTGVVEADETFFRKSYKGQRKGLPRPPKKRGGAAKDAEAGERVAVLVAMQRGARITTDRMLPDLSAASLAEALRPALGGDAVLSTDGNPGYPIAAARLGIESGSFVAGYHGHGGCGVWHVQNVNAYDSRLKGWMRRFHGVATKYLHHYLGWRRLLDRFKDSVTGQQFLFHALRTEYVNI
jgi:transposase-like protein